MSIYGNLKYDFTFPASSNTGSLILIKSITASASASVSFVNGSNGVVLDSTYKAYKFVFKNIHASVDATVFTFNMSTDSGSNYNVTKTTTFFKAFHNQADTVTELSYATADDLAQSTSYQELAISGTDNDQSLAGELWLYNPSSTIYVKHFISTMNFDAFNDFQQNSYIAGYGNTTSSVNAIDFKFESGNIDDGTISLYGLA